ncbi:MAG: hypothetical protein ABIQ72_03310 [Usitatibacter sp.]
MKFELDDPRRRTLVQMLAMGMLGGGSMASNLALAQILGSPPSKLPPGKSIYRISGDVQIDGKPGTLESRIAGGTNIKTGRNAELVYVVGESAYIARPQTEIVIETGSDSAIVTGLKLLTGKLLSVFPSRRPVRLTTQVATIGIRGTGVYMESDPEQTYFCTCYGVADVASNNDPQSKETITASHHDRPLYILGNEQAGKNIRNGPFINHTDQELMLIETLVGRAPPFVFPKADYSGPRRSY